jgi:hypothetical protein
MRRIALALALLVTMLVPGSVAAASDRCSVEVTPAAGGPTDSYRLTVSNVPVDPNGGSIEVRAVIKRLGSREGQIIFASLIPGVTEFYVDLNPSFPQEPPPDPFPTGRYLVLVSTPHLHGGCHATDLFVVS